MKVPPLLYIQGKKKRRGGNREEECSGNDEVLRGVQVCKYMHLCTFLYLCGLYLNEHVINFSLGQSNNEVDTCVIKFEYICTNAGVYRYMFFLFFLIRDLFSVLYYIVQYARVYKGMCEAALLLKEIFACVISELHNFWTY